ncbi:MAG TPA: hypothetical protein GX392_06600 [Clostridiales bacterium]|nr:hypothetical protein [Clostridiales bacterium]
MNKIKDKNMEDKITNSIMAFTKWMELILALAIIIAVIISTKDIFILMKQIYSARQMDLYNLFNNFLSHILLLIIGLELIETLITHTPSSIIDIMLFAIARKMLIHSSNAYELLVGAIAIAILFATRRFLIFD